MHTIENSTNLLWTGGWDSTFRLLQLLLEEKKSVQPYYLASGIRRSTDIEIETMVQIKEYLFKEYPGTQHLLSPIECIDVDDIEPNRDISESYNKIKQKNYIGDQYVLLARFGKQFKLNHLELCIHLDDKAHDILEPFVTKIKSGDPGIYHIEKNRTPEPIYHLFSNFTFPIFNYSKVTMADIAKDRNWLTMMNMTWFCHHPLPGQIPCGICNPCRYTIEEGLGWRVPIFFRLTGSFLKKMYNSPLSQKTRSKFSN